MKPTTRKLDVKQTMADMRRLIATQEKQIAAKDNQLSDMKLYIGKLLEQGGKNL